MIVVLCFILVLLFYVAVFRQVLYESSTAQNPHPPPSAEALARRQMLHLPQLDAALAKMITANRGAASDLAAHLLQQLVVLEPIISPNDLYATLDVLTRLAARMSNGAALMQLVEQARQAARCVALGHWAVFAPRRSRGTWRAPICVAFICCLVVPVMGHHLQFHTPLHTALPHRLYPT